ncbi:MAG: PDZ domain-containing protein [Leeuwenhoekiella sp.]
MRFLIGLFLIAYTTVTAQTNTYDISFEDAEHHEAVVKAKFPKIKDRSITVRMSRTSPGRYALHEFAKNVYGFKATNGKGEKLAVTRPDPYSWYIEGHDGTINIEYTLFANRADGTYSQVDETHAHLNIPATFIFAEGYEHRPVQVKFDVRKDLNWKVATQLKEEEGENVFSAPDLYYFMDSPVEVSNHEIRPFKIDGQTVKFVLHHDGSKEDFDIYFEQVKHIVEQEKAVFGELPKYDYGEYKFLACYLPNVSGDGMEHRNSTILTDTEGLAEGGMKGNIGTVSHEFFHCWNVERIRPDGLEPFDFKKANMSGALWFAEGFTSYYTGLILVRAGIIEPKEYLEGVQRTFNYVWNSPARQYFNPIEMSYQAPFVDAATSVDPVNRDNTFISYYSYGSILGLALDLSLREKDLNLDDFMKLVWNTFGKSEVAYNVADLEKTLTAYAGKEFAQNFFSKYIHDSQMPNYKDLFKSVGIALSRPDKIPSLGAVLAEDGGDLKVSRNPVKGSAAYAAKLRAGDIVTKVNDSVVNSELALKRNLAHVIVGDSATVAYKRDGSQMTTKLKLQGETEYTIGFDPEANRKALLNLREWLKAR